jgi:hypothetical protein
MNDANFDRGWLMKIVQVADWSLSLWRRANFNRNFVRNINQQVAKNKDEDEMPGFEAYF